MHSSNNSPSIAWRNPSFEAIIAFNYYDGPESGLAVYSSGEGIRFSSIGDSKNRRQRAFEMEAIEGDWRVSIELLRQNEGALESQRILVPRACQILTALKRDVLLAVTKAQYIAVGSPDLEGVLMLAVNSARLAELH